MLRGSGMLLGKVAGVQVSSVVLEWVGIGEGFCEGRIARVGGCFRDGPSRRGKSGAC